MSRTAKEALIAELLGDLDKLLSRVEKLPATIGEVEGVALQKQNEALQAFVKASERFNAITTQSVDDFVDVANEALSKFIQRTNELKTTLDKLNAKQVSVATNSELDIRAKTNRQYANLWMLPLVFLCGVVAGILLSFSIK